MSTVEHRMRLIDLAAIMAWVQAFSLLIYDTWLDGRSSPSLRVWTVMLGLLAVTVTNIALVTWLRKHVTIEHNAREIDDLLERRERQQR